MASNRGGLAVTVRRNAVSGWFADRSVNAKLLISVVVVACVALGTSLLSVARMATLNDELATMKAEHVDSLQQLSNLRGGFGTMFRGLFLLTSPGLDGATRDEGRRNVEQADQTVNDALSRYKELAKNSPDRLAALNDFSTGWSIHSGLRDAIILGKPKRADITIPAPDKIADAFINQENIMNASVVKLQRFEESESAAVASQAASDYRSARAVLIASLLAGLAVALGVAFWTARMIRRQLVDVGESLEAVAQGDLTRPATVRSRDELGQMAAAVNRANANIRETVGALTAGAQTLGVSSQRLTGVTERIAASAQATSAQVGVVASAAGSVSTNVQTVAAGSQEMGVSITEIAQNANEAARVASKAVAVAESTNQTVSKLGDSSAEIGNVVKVITSIAEQTNLLALNATIEAARAGDAGKGFAVVASEVKDLAQETARATEDISRRVDAIQSDTTDAVEAIAEISRIIAKINQYQVTIASAVEEQTATTAEMSRSVADAADGTSEIAATISQVAQAAGTTTQTLGEADGAVNELATLAAELNRVVGRFRV
ncbi:methyl-accepting chemotaxis protein [Virgisporangium aurantiacum]|uniref:Methyl-accepting chemotaxis protein n=1 Tax=Virgisporangium aurantiacum TaxID=175570 RepID=A0A8J3ZI18_9ACTN|nr:methyl-accepting chemotaxis protein [Virgisporangium aurantiacum]GIJ64594.1 hypothetical protein Vau01_121100 [Virgisporangium aurantiacum]